MTSGSLKRIEELCRKKILYRTAQPNITSTFSHLQYMGVVLILSDSKMVVPLTICPAGLFQKDLMSGIGSSKALHLNMS
jgi:hypothetical protein